MNTLKSLLLEYCFGSLYFLIFNFLFACCQVAFVAFVTGTLFFRTRLHTTDVTYGNLYLGCLFYGVVHMLFNGLSELSLMIHRLPVFYKQRDNCFYPAWAWSISSWILRIPYSVLESVVWSCVVYYLVGFAPEPERYVLLMKFHQDRVQRNSLYYL